MKYYIITKGVNYALDADDLNQMYEDNRWELVSVVFHIKAQLYEYFFKRG